MYLVLIQKFYLFIYVWHEEITVTIFSWARSVSTFVDIEICHLYYAVPNSYIISRTAGWLKFPNQTM